MKSKIIDTNQAEWSENEDGSHYINLWSEEKESFVLIKIPPECPPFKHKHLGDELVYILSGELIVNDTSHTQGIFLFNEKDSVHTTKAGSKGCTLLVYSGTI